MTSKTIEDYWTKREEKKFYRLKENDKEDELASFVSKLMIKYDLSPKVEDGFSVVKAVRKGRKR